MINTLGLVEKFGGRRSPHTFNHKHVYSFSRFTLTVSFFFQGGYEYSKMD